MLQLAPLLLPLLPLQQPVLLEPLLPPLLLPPPLLLALLQPPLLLVCALVLVPDTVAGCPLLCRENQVCVHQQHCQGKLKVCCCVVVCVDGLTRCPRDWLRLLPACKPVLNLHSRRIDTEEAGSKQGR
jgi:hypothetical protein